MLLIAVLCFIVLGQHHFAIDTAQFDTSTFPASSLGLGAVEMAHDVLAEHGMVRGWHDVYVRFGTNTTKTFGQASDPGIVLGGDDIFLIDIGPVFESWEGDGGDTFVTGSHPDMARAAVDARKLFHIVRRKWLADKASGRILYDFAVEQAKALGWELNMDLSGRCDHQSGCSCRRRNYDGSPSVAW